ncbi:MAG: helicase-related protein, partial [Bacteroidales bacterium]
RLPSAMDNRPLKFEEFWTIVSQTIYVSATPADFELQECEGVMVEQVIRPTGLLDPYTEVRPSLRQIDDLQEEIDQRIKKNERTLVTTLTKRMAEELTNYFTRVGIRCRYIHADVDTLERVEILRDLRLGTFDVLVGVNLLREGLDLPEVSLVAILDADKEGFLRSERSLTQTAGRAARNINSRVIMYADKVTESMKRMMNETNRRREKQIAYNSLNNITPTQITKSNREILGQTTVADGKSKIPSAYIEKEYSDIAADPIIQYLSKEKLQKLVGKNRKAMEDAVKSLDFLEAARLRDELKSLTKMLEGLSIKDNQ